MSDDIEVQHGSGNVFADLGLPNARELLLKAKLLSELNATIDRMKPTQRAVAKRLGIDQPKVSALRNGKLGGFSADRLIRYLNALGRDVEVIVRPRRAPSKRPATVRVKAA